MRALSYTEVVAMAEGEAREKCTWLFPPLDGDDGGAMKDTEDGG